MKDTQNSEAVTTIRACSKKLPINGRKSCGRCIPLRFCLKPALRRHRKASLSLQHCIGSRDESPRHVLPSRCRCGCGIASRPVFVSPHSCVCRVTCPHGNTSISKASVLSRELSRALARTHTRRPVKTPSETPVFRRKCPPETWERYASDGGCVLVGVTVMDTKGVSRRRNIPAGCVWGFLARDCHEIGLPHEIRPPQEDVAPKVVRTVPGRRWIL
jgi:hypothetical protein